MLKHLLLPLLVLPLAACSDAPAVESLADFQPPALRNTMFELDALNWSIEPILRDSGQTATVASSARSMQRWANDPSWTAYYDEPGFLGDRTNFDLFLGWLRAGLEQLASSAEVGNIDGMRAGFIRAQQSCIACHKRFNPNI
jgi:hypothetical protein